jgi:hypothetical protein
MDPRSILTTFQVEHRHSDGSLGVMVEDRPHHDAADHDPERGWGLRRIFRCKSCDEEVSIVVRAPDEAPAEH